MAITFLTNEDESKYVKSVNGTTPDEDGNVVVDVSGNGITPHIGENGNWFIGETDTGMPSSGKGIADVVQEVNNLNGRTKTTLTIQYTDGTASTITVSDGEDGTDGVDGIDGTAIYTFNPEGAFKPNGFDTSNVNIPEGLSLKKGDLLLAPNGDVYIADKYRAPDGYRYNATLLFNIGGTDGITPNIGDNGNWFIGESDTGVYAGGVVDNSVEPTEDDIPKVFFGAALPQTKDDTIMSFRYISKTKDISGYCKTKAQGSSSMNYPKKNQTVKLYVDAECTEKLKVDFKGWGKQNKFCFKANWIDITHSRNIVSAKLWGDVVKSRANYDEIPELLRTSPDQGAIDGFPVKVYAGGVYQGRYTLNIPKDAWMANMDDELDEHCILCGESNADDRCLFRSTANVDGSDWSDEVHDAVPNAIKIRWNEAINFIVNSTDVEFVSGVGSYFDVDSLIDYYLFGLATCGLDAFGKNQLYMTYDGQKWFATMYDLDSTWGLWWDGSSFVETNYARSEYQDFKEGNGNLLYIRLANLFSVEILNRWRELRSSVLTIDNIINRFERFADIASAELVKEDYASTTGNGDFTGIPSQSTNNIQQIRKYAIERLKYCDEFMNGTEIITGYSILEYIESNGSQHIDTGISGGANASYEIKMADTGSETWDTFIGGANGNNAAKIQHTGGNVIASIPSNSSGWFTLWDAGDTATHVVRYERTASCYVDGREIDYGSSTEQFAGLGWGDLTWYVFSSHAETWTAANMRLYYLKMYTDGVLVRDFVPVKRNADSAYGLYDKVTQTFFAGTGVFTGA